MNNLSNSVSESFDEATGSIGPTGYVRLSSTTDTIQETVYFRYDGVNSIVATILNPVSGNVYSLQGNGIDSVVNATATQSSLVISGTCGSSFSNGETFFVGILNTSTLNIPGLTNLGMATIQKGPGDQPYSFNCDWYYNGNRTVNASFPTENGVTYTLDVAYLSSQTVPSNTLTTSIVGDGTTKTLSITLDGNPINSFIGKLSKSTSPNSLSCSIFSAFQPGNGFTSPVNGVVISTITNKSQKHYDLRSFSYDTGTSQRTVVDLKYFNLGYLGGSGVNNFTVGQVQTFSNRTSSSSGYENWVLTTSGVGGLTITNIPTVVTIPGGNSLTTYLGRDGTYQYSNSLMVSLSGTNPSGTWSSTFNDDILTNFNETDRTYSISIVARDFPSQTAPLTIDLSKSYIDITSDSTGNYSSSVTDIIPLSQFTTISSSVTADSYIQFNRSQLTKADLSDLKGIRFRLQGRGTGAFITKFQEMKVLSDDYTYPITAINTKYGRYEGRLGISGSLSYASSGDFFFYPARPKNVDQYVKFNSGTSPNPEVTQLTTTVSGLVFSGSVTQGSLGSYPFPTMPFATGISGTGSQIWQYNTYTYNVSAPTYNKLKLYYRYTVDPVTYATSNINVNLTSSGGRTDVIMYQSISGTDYTLGSFTANLSNSTDYVLRTVVKDSTAESALYTDGGAFYGSRIATTGLKDLPYPAAPTRGYLGWGITPYNYDFNVNEISVGRAEFGAFESTNILSYKPVIAAQLTANSSPPIELLDSADFSAYGDASSNTSSILGNPPPDNVYSRSGGTQWSGGIISSEAVYLGDTSELYLTGSIFPHPVVNNTITYSGTFQVALLNRDSRVGYLGTFQNPSDSSYGDERYAGNLGVAIGNQWNDFSIPLNSYVVPGQYFVVIRNVGFYPSTFEVRDIALNHNTISWSLSNNELDFIPLYNNVNNPYGAVNFVLPNNKLKVRAVALSDTSNWIESYTLIPFYR